MSPKGDVLFRRLKERTDYVGEQNHFAGIAELLDAHTFAARVTRELRLSTSPHAQTVSAA